LKILGIDLGEARTGVAVSDAMGILASPVGTIEEPDIAALAQKIEQIAREHGVATLVLGHPRNMDGSRGESAQRAEAFAESLRQRGFEVVLMDERLTTVSATRYLNDTNTRGKKRKAVIDTVAATILLQEYLDSGKMYRAADGAAE